MSNKSIRQILEMLAGSELSIDEAESMIHHQKMTPQEIADFAKRIRMRVRIFRGEEYAKYVDDDPVDEEDGESCPPAWMSVMLSVGKNQEGRYVVLSDSGEELDPSFDDDFIGDIIPIQPVTDDDENTYFSHVNPDSPDGVGIRLGSFGHFYTAGLFSLTKTEFFASIEVDMFPDGAFWTFEDSPDVER